MTEGLIWAALGSAVGSCSVIPALHIYNVAGVLLLLVTMGKLPMTLRSLAFCFWPIAATQWANTLPSVFFRRAGREHWSSWYSPGRSISTTRG